jgi:hypothetical protein
MSLSTATGAAARATRLLLALLMAMALLTVVVVAQDRAAQAAGLRPTSLTRPCLVGRSAPCR